MELYLCLFPFKHGFGRIGRRTPSETCLLSSGLRPYRQVRRLTHASKLACPFLHTRLVCPTGRRKGYKWVASSDQRSTHLISRLSREEEANIRDVRGLGMSCGAGHGNYGRGACQECSWARTYDGSPKAEHLLSPHTSRRPIRPIRIIRSNPC